MSTTFRKRFSVGTESLNKLKSKIDELNQTGFKKDERFWQPEKDKSDTGYAVIRFLPPVDGEEDPWVRIFSHSFQGPGGWFIENCPTTIGGQCPLCKRNGILWNSGGEEGQKIVRNRKRQLRYVSNILVLKDQLHPENEGKVFLYKYGKKIFDKISNKMSPEFKDEQALNPFDFWEGADFKIKIKTVDGYTNYDSSEFAAQSALSTDDKQLEAIWKQQYPLQPLIDPSQFKTYEQLEERLNIVLNTSTVSSGPQTAESNNRILTSDTRNEVNEEPPFVASPSPKTTSMRSPKSNMDRIRELAAAASEEE